MAEYKRFSDFAEKEDNRLGGDKRHLDDILNVEILIKAYRVSKSKHYSGDYVTMQFEIDNALYVVFTSSRTIIEQLEKYSEKLPFLAKVVKIGKSYSLS